MQITTAQQHQTGHHVAERFNGFDPLHQQIAAHQLGQLKVGMVIDQEPGFVRRNPRLADADQTVKPQQPGVRLAVFILTSGVPDGLDSLSAFETLRRVGNLGCSGRFLGFQRFFGLRRLSRLSEPFYFRSVQGLTAFAFFYAAVL